MEVFLEIYFEDISVAFFLDVTWQDSRQGPCTEMPSQSPSIIGCDD
jgi:hypothetical protein